MDYGDVADGHWGSPRAANPPSIRAAERAGQKLLAQFAGDWDVIDTYFPMHGKPIVTKGTCKQSMVKDGKFLESDFTFFKADGTKSTGTGIPGFDSGTNRFTTVWYDSQRTEMSIRQSAGTLDGKNIVVWSTPLDMARRKTVARAHLEEGGRVLLYRHFLIASAKRLSPDPFAYLRDVFQRIGTHPKSRLAEMLPDQWKLAHQQLTEGRWGADMVRSRRPLRWVWVYDPARASRQSKARFPKRSSRTCSVAPKI